MLGFVSLAIKPLFRIHTTKLVLCVPSVQDKQNQELKYTFNLSRYKTCKVPQNLNLSEFHNFSLLSVLTKYIECHVTTTDSQVVGCR